MLPKSLSHTLVVLVFFASAVSLFAEPLPGTGELNNINWKLKNEEVAASLSARVRLTATVTGEQISYARTDLSQGLLVDGARYLFTKEGIFKEASFQRIFNLENEKTAQFFKDFATVTIEQYAKNLGKPDVDTSTSVDQDGTSLMTGTVIWQTNSKRAFQLEIDIIASGTLVYYSERCTNGAVK